MSRIRHVTPKCVNPVCAPPMAILTDEPQTSGQRWIKRREVSRKIYVFRLDSVVVKTSFVSELGHKIGGAFMARLLNYLAVAGFGITVAMPAYALEGNVDAGKKVFNKCAICHGIDGKKKPIGPTLDNVMGRTAGTEAEFLAKGNAGYSKAMIAAGEGGLVWTDEEILDWITNPKKKIPGTKMVFPGLPKEQDRADVLAYIKTFSPQ